MYRLNVPELLKIARAHGDDNALAIVKTTGVNKSSAYRILAGETQPDLITALRLSEAYDVDIRVLMDRVDAAEATA